MIVKSTPDPDRLCAAVLSDVTEIGRIEESVTQSGNSPQDHENLLSGGLGLPVALRSGEGALSLFVRSRQDYVVLAREPGTERLPGDIEAADYQCSQPSGDSSMIRDRVWVNVDSETAWNYPGVFGTHGGPKATTASQPLRERFGGDVPAWAAPARAEDLRGLPPTVTLVGDLEPFRDETIAYVDRLRDAGVPVRFEVFERCFHAFDVVHPQAEVSRRARAFWTEGLSG